MKIKVKIIEELKEIETNAKNLKELLEELKLKKEHFVFIKNGEVVLEDEKIDENDFVEFIPVFSGG